MAPTVSINCFSNHCKKVCLNAFSFPINSLKGFYQCKKRSRSDTDDDSVEQFDSFKAAGIDLNMSKILSSILKFDFNSIETFIDCMKKIHGPERKFARYNVCNGMLVIGDVENAKLTRYITQEKLKRPEILEAVMMSKMRERKPIPIEDRLENLEKLVLRHNSSINAVEDFVQKQEIHQEIETVKKVSVGLDKKD